MPTYTQTKALMDSSQGAIADVRRSIPKEKILSDGYKALINFNQNARIRVSLAGSTSNINRIPPLVLIEYAQVLNKIRRWKADQEPDFPTL